MKSWMAMLALALAATSAGCGGGGSDDPVDAAVIDGAAADATVVDASPPDAFVPMDAATSRVTWVLANGTKQVSAGGRTLNVVVGQPLGRPVSSASHTIQPGLLPQTKSVP